jgi:hypothetical protein
VLKRWVGRSVLRLFLSLMILTLTGCTANQWNEKLSTPVERALAAKAIASLRLGNIDPLKSQMEPQLFAETRAISGKIRAAFPQKGGFSLVTVNSTTFTADGTTTSTKALNYELGAGDQWALVQILLRESGGKIVIAGWHATPTSTQPTAMGNFDFHDKGALSYFWILAMIASTATILAAAVQAFCSRGIRYRWLWIIGSLIGLVQFSMNWTTGAWGVRPIAFSIFGSAFMKSSPFDAWILSFSLPIVAVAFLLRRSKMISRDAQASADAAF